MPKETPSTEPLAEDSIPDIQPPESASTPPELPVTLWVGGTLVITQSNREALFNALSELFDSTEPKYLLEVQPEGDLLIAINAAAIALMSATYPNSTVPRYFNGDWNPERNLGGDRIQDQFTFSGTLKAFDGSTKQLREVHRKVAENLWLVTIG